MALPLPPERTWASTPGIDSQWLIYAREPAWFRQHDEHAGAGRQGHRRPQRVRPLVGHPPGRRAQEPRELRDHRSGRCGTRRVGHRAYGPQRSRGAEPSSRSARLKLEQTELDEVYAKFLDLADKKKDIRHDDLLYLVGATTGEKITKRIKLKYLQRLTGTPIPTATVIFSRKDRRQRQRSGDLHRERTGRCGRQGDQDADQRDGADHRVPDSGDEQGQRRRGTRTRAGALRTDARPRLFGQYRCREGGRSRRSSTLAEPAADATEKAE